MTAGFFEEYVHTLDQKLDKENRKVIFIVDNCAGHGEMDNLKAVTIEFLPQNMTSILQPKDRDIEITRKLYNKRLLRQILLSYDNGKGY